ncbi:MAG: YdeI/OmpD-associated family protein [Pseudomonadota bacterium]
MAAPRSVDALERVEVKRLAELRAWFEHHYAQSDSIWLVSYKKSTPAFYITNTDVVDECICFNWMDGRRMKLDEQRTMQLLSPRKAQHWSNSYKARYARLEQAGRLHAVAIRQAQIDQASGAWSLMDDVDNLVLPDDLKAALKQTPNAWEHYQAFPNSTKRDILRWIKLAKRAETRARRILDTARKAAQNVRASGTGVR